MAQETALTSDSYYHWYPQWSPDGNWIVYQKDDTTTYYQIYKTPSEVGIEETKTGIRQKALGIRVYPNPFSQLTVIRFQIPDYIHPQGITLQIYDLTGRWVRTLVNEHKNAGYYTMRWDAKDNSGKRLSSGIYFLRLETDSYKATRKLTILR